MCRVINYEKSSCCNYARSDGYTLNSETMIDLYHQRTMYFDLN